jgi:eukaryotic-like serine/threonine-protein kinase
VSDVSRWAQVTAVFQEALERDEPDRAAYLDTACAGDAPLRAEVESLLAAHQAAGGFAEGSPLEALPPSAVAALSVNTRLAPGSQLGAYVIAAPLGAGGMGEVYRARDGTLNRDVAVKVLPDLVAHDRDRLARFTREAQILAALNHPNIVTVHSVEEDRGVHFITMELVKGTTLAEILPRDGFALDRFFDLAIPLADAVAAAHAQGVVHRDLKPANVMVTPEGRVKVLDFGLARPATGAAQGPGDLTAVTEAGAVLGTHGYLSPEQARGQAVDARSDIFALGIVFYEMLTGGRPFVGDTPTDVLSSILKDVPPAVSTRRAGIPRELARLVRRCLVKDPARRIQSAVDIRTELEELKHEMDAGELFAEARPAPVRAWGASRAWWTAGAAIVILLLGGAAGWMLSEPPRAPSVRLTKARQLTFTAGVESFPTWSPDGGRIAYVSDQSGNNDIWVVPAAGGAAVNFTADHRGNDTHPAWSPDGNQIAFVSDRDPNRGGIYVMPALGGRPERISPRGSAETASSPQWSADGSELAHMRREPEGNFIEIVSLATRQTRRVSVPGEQGNRFDLSWSRDGRYFAYVRAANRDQEVNRLWVLRAADEEAFAVTDETTGAWSPMWSADGRTLFFLSNRGGSVDLWQQRISAQGSPDGEASPLTVGIGMRAAALSADGRTLAYARGRPVANVWRVPILDDRETGWDDAEQVTSDEAFVQTFDLLPDGERLIVSSDRGGSLDLWLVAMDGTETRQLTDNRGPDGAPRVSPDGSQIAFHSHRQGNLDIWVLPTDGGPSVQLTSNPLSDMFPAWSPDSGMIAYYGQRGGGVNLFVMPAAGGEPRQITMGDVSKYFPQWSPDANWIFFASGTGPSGRQIFRMPAEGGAPKQVTKAPAYYVRWSSDGTRLYFPGNERGSHDLWELTVANGRERRLTQFPPGIGELGSYALAASKTHLYFTLRKDVGDIWVMDVVTDDER